MSTSFLNPYHFVPVDSGPSTDSLDRSAIQKKDGDQWKQVKPVEPGDVGEQVTHDRYFEAIDSETQLRKYRSGRIICRLTVERPVSVGAKQVEASNDMPNTVHPFQLNGQAALPATSLRGMISSVAEAASNSAMRVMSNEPMSVRVGINDDHKLSAIGMILCRNGKLTLSVLTFPNLVRPAGNTYFEVPPGFKRFIPNLPVYVDGYHREGNDRVVLTENSFVNTSDPDSFSSTNVDELWYANLQGVLAIENNKLFVDDSCWHGRRNIKIKRPNGRFQKCDVAFSRLAKGDPLREQPSDSGDTYTKGVLRILGVPENRETEMPRTKKHELFIPLPDGIFERDFLDVEDAVARFHQLADERTASRNELPLLPFEPKGRARDEGGRIRLAHGDLVYFRLDDRDLTRVAEVSISAIWRRSAGTPAEQFSQDSGELTPFHRNRSTISLAERVFGFVQTDKKDKDNDKPGKSLALAGRVTFTDARLAANQSQPYYGRDGAPAEVDAAEWFTLKELSSPKPPCPSLYFKRKNGESTLIAKQDLSDAHVEPQGRKMYLHQHDAFQGKQTDPWVTKDPDPGAWKRKSRVQLLRAGVEFCFAVDYENLSQTELDLLIYALRPTEVFRHLLGMGKPLGLGRVRIDPLALLDIDRFRRYESDHLFDDGQSDWRFDSPRFHHARLENSNTTDDGNAATAFVSWLSENGYADESAAFAESPDEHVQPFVEKARKGFRESSPCQTQWAIVEKLGDPAGTEEHPVHYPLRVENDRALNEMRSKIEKDFPQHADQARAAALERELYKWWMYNEKTDKRKSQQLQPIEPTKPLPTLQRLAEPER